MTPSIPRGLVSYGSYKSGAWKLQDLIVRPLQQGEVLVEMVAAGICHTDLHFTGAETGLGIHYPRVMGHEGAGYVRQVGSGVTTAQIGDPVILSFSFCQDCDTCRRGHPAHCLHAMNLNVSVEPENYAFKTQASAEEQPDKEFDIYGSFFGQSSFANFSIVRESSVVNVSGLVNEREELKLLSPLGCGIQTGTGTILGIANAGPDDRILILGLGGVGLSAVMAAKISQCKQIIGVDLHQSRLDLAKELGATHVVKAEKGPDAFQAVTKAVRELTGQVGCTITVDTTGVPEVIAEGLEMTAFKGKYLQIGLAPDDAVLKIPITLFMLTGKQFIGVIEGDVNPKDYIPRMVQWVKDGSLPLHKIVKFYPADDFERAISDMNSGEAVKPVLLW
ncbi:hypothetical protein LTS12_028015 [Elasticomyces elasticus]|nr:hypothetical protein LTS12_028015 [Elasticomyces elasticus]